MYNPDLARIFRLLHIQLYPLVSGVDAFILQCGEMCVFLIAFIYSGNNWN